MQIFLSLPIYVFFFALFNGTIMMIVNHYGKPGALHLTAVNKITHDCYMIFTFASKRLKRDCKHDFDCDCDCDRNLIEIYLIESFDMIEYKKIFKKRVIEVVKSVASIVSSEMFPKWLPVILCWTILFWTFRSSYLSICRAIFFSFFFILSCFVLLFFDRLLFN